MNFHPPAEIYLTMPSDSSDVAAAEAHFTTLVWSVCTTFEVFVNPCYLPGPICCLYKRLEFREKKRVALCSSCSPAAITMINVMFSPTTQLKYGPMFTLVKCCIVSIVCIWFVILLGRPAPHVKSGWLANSPRPRPWLIVDSKLASRRFPLVERG